MADSVKFIFKTLVKVPVIIMVSFLIFNVFSWTISYFKLVGASFTVMQVGMENNYIPAEEEAAINSYLSSLETGVMGNVRITGEPTYRYKRQYGDELTIGVRADLQFIWPLMHHEQFKESNNPDETFGNMLTSLEMQQARRDNESTGGISITYKVPGLQYYSDLD